MIDAKHDQKPSAVLPSPAQLIRLFPPVSEPPSLLPKAKKTGQQKASNDDLSPRRSTPEMLAGWIDATRCTIHGIPGA
jgi:hypothetical protein